MFAPLFDPDASAALEAELVWFAGLLGEVRDRDILIQRLLGQLSELPAEVVLGSVAAHIETTLLLERSQHQARVREAMSGERYHALMKLILMWQTRPPLTKRAESRPNAERYLRRAENKVMRRLAEAGGDVDALHSARKAAKRYRYAAELTAEAAARRPPGSSSPRPSCRPCWASIKTAWSAPISCGGWALQAGANGNRERLHLWVLRWPWSGTGPTDPDEAARGMSKRGYGARAGRPARSGVGLGLRWRHLDDTSVSARVATVPTCSTADRWPDLVGVAVSAVAGYRRPGRLPALPAQRRHPLRGRGEAGGTYSAAGTFSTARSLSGC